MAPRPGGNPGRTKAKPLIEDDQQLPRGEPADLSGSQFDGQGKPVQRMTDRCDGVAILVDELVVRPFRGASNEQLDRRESDCLINRQPNA